MSRNGRGNPLGLARAEREIGLDSWAVAFRSSRFRYEPDELLWNNRESPLAHEFKRWRLLWRAVRDFDVVHFNFGMSIMPMMEFATLAPPSASSSLIWKKRAYGVYARMFELRDLPLLRRAGKGILVTYQHVLPPKARFLPYSRIDLRDRRSPERNTAPRRPPVVAHSPRHRGVKGTRFVQDGVSRLKTEGVPMEFLLVKGVSNAQVRCILERADLVVGQLLTGWHGAVAVEAMALAKPVICYIRQNYLKFIPEEMRKDLPIINATPATFYGVLRKWVTTRKHELPQLGIRSRKYVEKWHDPLKIAACLKLEYEKIMTSK